MDNNNKKPVQQIRGEIKYIIFIMIFVAGIIFNYLTISNTVSANTYRITQIEQASAEMQTILTKRIECLSKMLVEMQIDVAKIKVKLGIEN